MTTHKKLVFVVTVLVLIILSTGCQLNENFSSKSTSGTSVSTTTQKEGPENINNDASSVDENIMFVGTLGETLCTDDAYVIDENTYRFEGWTYIGLSDGVTWNTIDNGDGIDTNDFPENMVELFKVEEGYTINGLTMDEAAVDYIFNNGEAFLKRIHAEFSGRLALEGFFYTFPTTEGYEEKGDIFFLVCNGEWSGMPYADTSFGCWHWWTDNDFHWISNAPLLRLGNIEDYDFDLSFIKSDGNVVRAKVVLDGLEVIDGYNVSKIYKSTIIDAEPL